jgi:hypothetical protein
MGEETSLAAGIFEMTRSLELVAAGATLRLHTNDKRWCRAQLCIGELVTALGADVEHILIERLARALQDELPSGSAGEIAGESVACMFGLSEEHCTIYANNVAAHRRLYFQGSDGNIVGKLILTTEERRKWIALLSAHKDNDGGF